MQHLFKTIITLFFMLGLQGACAKEASYIHFQRKQSDHTIRFKLPLKCRLYQSDEDKRFGSIVDYSDRAVFFEYKDYDTAQVNQLLAIDSLKKKERYDLADSLIEHSKLTKEIPFEKILKISILSGSDRLGRELILLGSGLGFMVSGVALMITTANHANEGFSVLNGIQLGAMGVSTSLMAALIKRNINMEKWDILPKQSEFTNGKEQN